MLLERVVSLPGLEEEAGKHDAENFRTLSEQKVVLGASLKIRYLGERRAEGQESFP